MKTSSVPCRQALPWYDTRWSCCCPPSRVLAHTVVFLTVSLCLPCAGGACSHRKAVCVAQIRPAPQVRAAACGHRALPAAAPDRRRARQPGPDGGRLEEAADQGRRWRASLAHRRKHRRVEKRAVGRRGVRSSALYEKRSPPACPRDASTALYLLKGWLRLGRYPDASAAAVFFLLFASHHCKAGPCSAPVPRSLDTLARVDFYIARRAGSRRNKDQGPDAFSFLYWVQTCKVPKQGSTPRGAPCLWRRRGTGALRPLANTRHGTGTSGGWV